MSARKRHSTGERARQTSISIRMRDSLTSFRLFLSSVEVVQQVTTIRDSTTQKAGEERILKALVELTVSVAQKHFTR